MDGELDMSFITNHIWLDPLNHFLTSAILGYIAYLIAKRVFKTKVTVMSLAMFVAISAHVLADMLWG